MWEGADGALPHIEQALTGDEVAAEIRAEIVAEVAPELDRELPRVARDVANSIFATWTEFKQRHVEMLRLAERNPRFKAIMQSTSTDEVYKLAQLVGVGTEVLGAGGLDDAIDRGRFERLFRMPAGADAILKATGSIETTLAWGDLAGERIGDLAKLEIVLQRKPEQMDKQRLKRLLDLDDAAVVSRLLVLEDAQLDALLELTSAQLQRFGRGYEVDDLLWLGKYLEAIPAGTRRSEFIDRLQKRPKIVHSLKSESIKRAIAGGGDVENTLNFVATPRSFSAFLSDSASVLDGGVPWQMMWLKYGTPKNVAITVVVLIVWVALRQLRRRRDRRPIVVNVSVPAPEHGKENTNEPR